jgi:hypothetical protein
LLAAAGAGANNAPRPSAGDKVDLHLTPPTPLTVAVSKDRQPTHREALGQRWGRCKFNWCAGCSNDCWPQRAPEEVNTMFSARVTFVTCMQQVLWQTARGCKNAPASWCNHPERALFGLPRWQSRARGGVSEKWSEPRRNSKTSVYSFKHGQPSSGECLAQKGQAWPRLRFSCDRHGWGFERKRWVGGGQNSPKTLVGPFPSKRRHCRPGLLRLNKSALMVVLGTLPLSGKGADPSLCHETLGANGATRAKVAPPWCASTNGHSDT